MGASSPQIWVALGLTMIGSLSTALGGLLVIIQAVPSMKRLGLLQGFAAGLMLSLSFFDLLPNAINAVGFAYANLWFFAGALMFAGVVALIPEPSLGPINDPQKDKATAPPQMASDKDSSEDKGGGGGGAQSMSRKKEQQQRKQVLFSGIITAIGISLHNFPEGIAVFLGSLKGLKVGVSLAIAIALHNIPEGLAVALPIYYATKSRWKAFQAAAFSGVAEPLAVVFVAFVFPGDLKTELIEGMLAGVGGIMAFLTIHEMLPLAFEYSGHRVAVAAVFVGMAVMSANLHLLATCIPSDIAL